MSITIETREQQMLKPLLEFFSHQSNFNPFVQVVVTKQKNIPLRVLDWLVTNYSKSRDISYNIKRPNGKIETFHLHRSYKANLRSHKKLYFDSFCRGLAITLEYEDPVDGHTLTFQTALCQLKFFKWAIENLIIDYVEANYDQIYEDMVKNSSQGKKAQKAQKDGKLVVPRKKKPLSSSLYNTMHVSAQPVTFSFTSSTPTVEVSS